MDRNFRSRVLSTYTTAEADVYGSPEGLSGDNIYAIFEDRENNIWVATVNGLDRFRDFAVVTLEGIRVWRTRLSGPSGRHGRKYLARHAAWLMPME